eukprot:scaffold32651_cov112-Isochrysis_galbana.AAC.3
MIYGRLRAYESRRVRGTLFALRFYFLAARRNRLAQLPVPSVRGLADGRFEPVMSITKHPRFVHELAKLHFCLALECACLVHVALECQPLGHIPRLRHARLPHQQRPSRHVSIGRSALYIEPVGCVDPARVIGGILLKRL